MASHIKNVVLFLFIINTSFAQFNVTNDLSGNACAPQTVNFYISNPPPATVTYNWFWDDGTSDISYGDTAHQFTSGGNFNVRLEALDGFGSFLDAVNFQIDIGGVPTNIYGLDTACPGENLRYDVPSTYDSYSWDWGDGNTTVGSSREFHTYSTTGTYNITLTLSGGACPGGNVSKTVEIMNGLAFNTSYVDLNINPQVSCPNDLINFDYHGSTEFFDSYQRLWEFGDGDTSSESQTTHAYASSGQKIIKLNFTNACGNTTFVSDTVDIQNGLTPSVDSIIFSSNPVCPGNNVEFSATGQNIGTFKWFVNGGGTPDINPTVNFSYLDTGSYLIRLDVTNGCGNSSLANNRLLDVKNGLPFNSYNLGALIAPMEACAGDTISFFALAPDAIDYVWNFGDGTVKSGPNVVHAFATTGTKPVSTIFTNGCGADTVITSLVRIKNNVSPPLFKEGNQGNNNGPVFGSFGIPDGTNQSCPNDSVLFFIFGHYSTITWDFGDGTSSNETIKLYATADDEMPFPMPVNIIRHAYSDTGIFMATITVSNTCGNTATDSIQVAIVGNVPANADFVALPPLNGNSYLPCEEIRFVSFNGSSYSWDFGDGTTLTTSSSEVNHQFINPGTYNVTLAITNSCGNSSTAINSIYVQQTGAPNADFSATPLSGIAPLTVQFTNLSTNAAIYEWTFSDGTVTNAVNPLHTFYEVDAYDVTLKSSTICGTQDVSSQISYITTTALNISGTVYSDTALTPLASGTVVLYRKKVNGLFDSLRTVNINTDGTYSFTNALQGQYFISAKPNTTTYPNLLPTYHYDNAQWFDADPVVVDQDVSGIDIICQTVGNSGSGSGRVYGNVIQGNTSGKTGKVQGPGDPFNGIDVSLIDKSTGSAIARQTSGANSGDDGGFDFTGVANNTYNIYVDVTGVPTDAGFEIPIDASNQSVYVVIIVDSNLISFTTTSVEEFKEASNINGFTVFPNPYNDFTNIVYTLTEKSNVKLEVFSMIGERVKLIEDDIQKKGTYNYIFSGKKNNLAQGFYIIRLKANNAILTQKILEIKQ